VVIGGKIDGIYGFLGSLDGQPALDHEEYYVEDFPYNQELGDYGRSQKGPMNNHNV
jgi:hypothetical protein